VTALAVAAAAELLVIAFLLWERRGAQAPLLRAIEGLCQRVQAPQAAVVAYDEQSRERRDEEYAPPALEPEDDQGYWATREQMAEYEMRAEIAGGRDN
jgi:hypothetical protein